MVSGMDEVGLSIVALVVSSMAIFGGLWQAGGPKLAGSFYGENPFAIKAAAINYYIERIFVVVGLAGVGLQAAVYVFADELHDRLYTTSSYLAVFGGAFCFTVALLLGLRSLALARAKKTWLPILSPHQTNIYHDLVFAAEHDGLLSDYWGDRTGMAPSRKMLNDDRVATNLEQLEELFLDGVQEGSLQERVQRLANSFPTAAGPAGAG